MYYVYYLSRGDAPKDLYYVGLTKNLKNRLVQHAKGNTSYTKVGTWRLECYFAFRTKTVAARFEKYLKKHSGREFARRHFES